MEKPSQQKTGGQLYVGDLYSKYFDVLANPTTGTITLSASKIYLDATDIIINDTTLTKNKITGTAVFGAPTTRPKSEQWTRITTGSETTTI